MPLISKKVWTRNDWLCWLVVMTGSAVWMSASLLNSESPTQSGSVCGFLYVAAWTTVFFAWRRFRERYGGWRMVYVAVVFLNIILAGELKGILVPPPAPVIQIVPPEVAHYHALTAAVHAENLGAVKSILRHYRLPDFHTESEIDYSDGNDGSADERDPLYTAVELRNLPIATVLLQNGAEISTDYDATNPLIAAAELGDIRMMRLLMHHGANVNNTAHDSFALWFAIRYGQRDAVAFLLARGANANTVGADDHGDGETVLQLARHRRLEQIARLIERAGGK